VIPLGIELGAFLLSLGRIHGALLLFPAGLVTSDAGYGPEGLTHLVVVKDTSSPKANSKLDAFDIVFGLGKARELPKELIANLDAPINVCNCVHGFKALTALVEFAYRRAAVPDDGIRGSRDHFVSAVNVP
tara:strand:+ start:322 stop:714 length:393 start_codon:yes stop_codon:yes gene_type:complete